MGSKSLHVLLLLSVFYQCAAAGYYFSTHGAFNNSCKVTVCSTCLTGQYKLGCVNASLGVCANCTRIPNATFTTHGGFSNSCNFTCNTGFYAVGRSCNQVQMQYSVSFPASITLLNGTNQTFNLTTYINAVAGLAGCAECGNARLSPIQCGICSVFYDLAASIPVVYRRLLSSASVVTVNTTLVTGSRTLADAAVANINSDTLNSKMAVLSNSNSGTVSVTKAPTLTTQAVTVVPPPPPTPPIIIPETTPTGDAGSNIGAIAGGAIGGVVGLALIAVLVWYFAQKKPTQPKAPPITPAQAQTTVKSIFAFKQGRREGTPKLASQFVYVRKT
jgi:hypothetical protein